MCSYNSVNGAPACANSYLIQDILRSHWGWEKDEHWISTDCGVLEDTWKSHKYVATAGEAAAALLAGGTDLNCEFGKTDGWFEAWENGNISEEDIDKALVRLWASLVTVGWFDPAEDQSLRRLTFQDVNTPESQKLAYEAAVTGAVLIKNSGHLPLDKNKKVALIGPFTDAAVQMQGNYYGPAPYLISPRQAAEEYGLDFTWTKGVGINEPDSTSDQAVQAAKDAEEIVFFGGIDTSIEEESRDRPDIAWPEPQLELLRELISLGKPVTVIQFGGGQLDGTELLESDVIEGILWAGYPGQSGGQAVIDLLYGERSPAGRLPVTQYPSEYIDQVPPTDMTLRPGQNGTNPGRTHMWYTGNAPVPFGHGLHYTEFDVKLGQISWTTEFTQIDGDISKVDALLDTVPWLELINKPTATVPVQVENIGNVTSDYVALLFLRANAGPEPRPKQTLVGYTRLKNVAPGATETAEVNIQLERFLRVDEDGNQVLYPGTFEMFVDIDEKASVEIEWTGSSLIIEEFPHQK